MLFEILIFLLFSMREVGSLSRLLMGLCIFTMSTCSMQISILMWFDLHFKSLCTTKPFWLPFILFVEFFTCMPYWRLYLNFFLVEVQALTHSKLVTILIMLLGEPHLLHTYISLVDFTKSTLVLATYFSYAFFPSIERRLGY